MSRCGTILTEHLPNVGRGPQTSEMARKSPHDWVGQMKKKEREKGIGTGSVPSEGAVREESFLHPGSPLTGGTEGELHLRGERNNQFAEGKMERGLPAQTVNTKALSSPA